VNWVDDITLGIYQSLYSSVSEDMMVMLRPENQMHVIGIIMTASTADDGTFRISMHEAQVATRATHNHCHGVDILA
jgi:hypothetical protein